jgi:hypothetical protein
VAVTGLAFFAPSSAALAKGTVNGTTVDLTVGKFLTVPMGSGPSFNVASCAPANGTQVGCLTFTSRHLASDVRVWCLQSTPSPVDVVVSYLPDGATPAAPSTTLQVNCAAARVKTVHVGNTHVMVPLVGISSVASCSTDTFGATCTPGTGQKTVTERCDVSVTSNVLPALVTATAVVNGNSAVNGKTVLIYFICA